ncbi:MAG: hypothetical protein COA32_01445 [Fluviicola sp.]|nr:MAG: hypothetical protein COA32_01445 [Fluviicola sp.]
MSGENKTLFLFTAGYPYGTRDEPFLETEINYLSKKFSTVIIFPRIKKNEIRDTPSNVKVVDFYSNLKPKNKLGVLLRNPTFLLRVLFKSKLKVKYIIDFIKHYRVHLDILASGIFEGEKLVELFKKLNIKEDDVVYDYWFINSIISIDYWRSKKKHENTLICRAHRYDLYPEEWKMSVVPFTFYRLNVVNRLVFISKHGLNYLNAQTNREFNEKFQLSYLGVNSPEKKNPQELKELYRIVSCARVVDFKNVHLIPKVLSQLNTPIEWVHFGDGPMMSELEKNILDLPKNIKVILKGHQSNREVLYYYENTDVDAFISLSDSEGLPVSMMEAQSFGIPIIAKNVGGTNEIVNESTGLLLENNAPIPEIAADLSNFIEFNKIKREGILSFFNENFNASQNYELFIEQF